MSRVLLAALGLLAAAPALAASPRWGSFELYAGQYLPDIDSEFTAGGPYEQVFGGDRGWMFQVGVSRALYKKGGSLELGFRTGYFQETGIGIVSGTTDTAGEETKLKIIPTSLALTYRFDWLVDNTRVPFAPYGRATFERYNWWVTDGGGSTAERGATMGWSVTGGLAFLLDIVDPTLAREMDADVGVNHTFLFFEVTTSSIDDFGSSSSWDLSDESVSLGGGLLFVF